MRISAYEIKLAENQSAAENISKVQLLRAGKYKHWDESTLEITADMLRNMKKNFDSGVKKVDLAIDYYHNSYGDAAGWVKEVQLQNNDTELWCVVEWTEAAKDKILSKELRYLSADFDMDYMDNETGEKHGVTLNGGGLTNRPFVKGMNPILSEIAAVIDKDPEKIDHIRKLLSETPKLGNETMNFEELKKALVTVQLSEDQKKEFVRLMGFEDKTVKLTEDNVALKAQLSGKDKEISDLNKKLADIQKESDFNVLLSEGKAVPAQKDAFLSGDTAAFARLSVPVNKDPKGTGNPKLSEDKAPSNFEEAEAKAIKLAQEKRKADPKLSYAEATRQVLSENEDLRKILNEAA